MNECKVFFCALPQGNIVHLGHFCLDNNFQMDEDMAKALIVTTIIAFAELSSQEMMWQYFTVCL